MSAFLRNHDWTASPLGVPAHWPRPLRSATSLVLDASVPMWLAWGADLAVVYNDAYAGLIGNRHPSALGAPLQQTWADIWPRIEPLVAQTLSGRGLHREDFALLPDRGGRDDPAWGTFSLSPLRDDDGIVHGLISTVWDTTSSVAQRRPAGDASAAEPAGTRGQETEDFSQRKAAEAALRESERLFQTLFESIDEGFCVIEFLDGPHGPLSDYVHIMANPAYAAHTGIQNVVGQRVRDMVPQEAEGWVQIYRNVLVTGEPVRFERELESTGRYLELSALRIEPVERRQVAVLFQDVTQRHRVEQALREMNDTLERRVGDEVAERIKAEAALRQSQKMEAVGQLTGGIAHDFNNMLAVIHNSLELIDRRFVGADERAKQYVGTSKAAVKRAAHLTQRLLAFSRQQPLRPESIAANRLVAGMSELLTHSLGGHVRLETVLAGGLWRTYVDPNQLENAILNLAVNGRDAMPDNGRLTIETANCHLDERYATEHLGLNPGQYIMIAVSDTGCGMSADVVARAFDPFFTTKAVGRGTGLGLSQVYGFVKQSGGHVKIYSEVGQGTVVKIYLPRHLDSAADDLPASGVASIPQGNRREVVLVVEDEDAVRQLSVDMLAELGYQPLQADSAAAALRLLDAHPEISLLFTDVVMPDVNGRKLADEALRRRPGLKILFTSGYTRNAVVHNGVLDSDVQLIGKPFTMDELATRVREVLDAS